MFREPQRVFTLGFSVGFIVEQRTKSTRVRRNESFIHILKAGLKILRLRSEFTSSFPHFSHFHINLPNRNTHSPALMQTLMKQ